MPHGKTVENLKTTRNRSKAAKPKTGSRIFDFLLIVAALAVLVFIGSFALKFTQGETAPSTDKANTVAVAPVSVRLQVLNGCGVVGVAGRFSKLLTDSGKPDFIVDVIDERNFDTFKQEKTMLIARKDVRAEAERLAAKIGMSIDRVSIKALEDNFLGIDYSLVIGADYDQYLSRVGTRK
jgi:hypothetical protein